MLTPDFPCVSNTLLNPGYPVDDPRMALDGTQGSGGTPKTVEQLLHSDNPTAWNVATGLGRIHDPEEDHFHHVKKLSVIAKVKEKAKRWRQTLVRKRFGNDANHTPSWGVSLEDYEVEEDPDHHGPSKHQSHLQQEHKSIKDKNFSDHSDTLDRDKLLSIQKNAGGPALTRSFSGHHGSSAIARLAEDETSRAKSFHHHSEETQPSQSELIKEALIMKKSADKQKQNLQSSEVTAETRPSKGSLVADKAENSREVAMDETDEISADEDRRKPLSHRKSDPEEADSFHSPDRAVEESEMQGQSCRVTDQDRERPPLSTSYGDQETEKPAYSKKTTESEGGQGNAAMDEQENTTVTRIKAITEAVSVKLAPAYATVSEATSMITSKLQGLSIPSLQGNTEEQKWDKGVSVKEYFKNKLEPGEDERALSQVISEVISPRRSPEEKGVVEKMKTAVTLLLQSNEPSASSSIKTSESSTRIPVSTNAHEVEEENQGRVLQAN